MSVTLTNWPAELPPHRLLRPGDERDAVALRITANTLRRASQEPVQVSEGMALLAAAACDEVAMAIEMRDSRRTPLAVD